MRAALEEARAPRRRVFACSDVVAAALPDACAAKRWYVAADALPFWYRIKCTRHVAAAARLFARRAGLPVTSVAGSGPAWGVVSCRGVHAAICFRNRNHWFALSTGGGLVRIDPRLVSRAWSVDRCHQ